MSRQFAPRLVTLKVPSLLMVRRRLPVYCCVRPGSKVGFAISIKLYTGDAIMIRHAEAQWNGSVKEGTGHVKPETGAVDSAYSFKSRFVGGGETNPEELLGAARGAWFSLELSG